MLNYQSYFQSNHKENTKIENCIQISEHPSFVPLAFFDKYIDNLHQLYEK